MEEDGVVRSWEVDVSLVVVRVASSGSRGVSS